MCNIQLPGRIGKQCRERWFNHLDPAINKGDWNSTEERILFEAQRHFGNRWCEISKLLPGRTENAVKNRWNSCTMRKFLQENQLVPGPNTRFVVKPSGLPYDSSGTGIAAGVSSTSEEIAEAFRLFEESLRSLNIVLQVDAQQALSSLYAAVEDNGMNNNHANPGMLNSKQNGESNNGNMNLGNSGSGYATLQPSSIIDSPDRSFSSYNNNKNPMHPNISPISFLPNNIFNNSNGMQIPTTLRPSQLRLQSSATTASLSAPSTSNLPNSNHNSNGGSGLLKEDESDVATAMNMLHHRDQSQSAGCTHSLSGTVRTPTLIALERVRSLLYTHSTTMTTTTTAASGNCGSFVGIVVNSEEDTVRNTLKQQVNRLAPLIHGRADPSSASVHSTALNKNRSVHFAEDAGAREEHSLDAQRPMGMVVPMLCLYYFRFLSDSAQEQLMAQLVAKFQRTSITPRNFDLLATPRIANLVTSSSINSNLSTAGYQTITLQVDAVRKGNKNNSNNNNYNYNNSSTMDVNFENCFQVIFINFALISQSLYCLNDTF